SAPFGAVRHTSPERVVAGLAAHHVVVEEHVVGVQLLRRDRVCVREVACRPPGQLVTALHHNQNLLGSLVIDDGTARDRGQGTLRFLGGGLLPLNHRGGEVYLPRARPVRESSPQRGGLHLLRRPLTVITRRRPVDRAATNELRRTLRSLARPAGALPAVRLLATSGHLTPGLGVVGALPRGGGLGSHDLMHQRNGRLAVEHVARQLDSFGCRTGRRLDLYTAHFATPPFASPILAALRTKTTPFFGPGTAPLTNSRPCSGCTACTVRPCVVLRALPSRPGICFPLKT